MAGSIKGIIVEIGGDTSGLQKALKKVNSSTSSLSKELKGINSLLKLDPKNTELLSQKQKVLKENIAQTSKKLEELKKAQEMADETIANGGEISKENYRNLQREIINTESKLKQLKVEASNWTAVSKKMSSISEGLNKISTAVSSLGSKITKSVTLPMVALGTATATTSVSFLKLKEDTKTAFRVLLGSAEKAQKMLDDLYTFAKTTPFSYATYLETGKSLVSMGIAAENVIPYLEGITNAAIATGNGEEAITSISSALGKMTTQTKLSLEYMYQISDQGIPVFKILGNQLGVSTSKLMEMISAGKLASNEMIPKLIEGINNGTDGINGATSAFAGLATETKSNLSGAIDSLKSKFRNMSMEIWNAEEAYPELSKVIREFTKSLDVLPKIFKSISKAAVPVLQTITKAFNSLNEKLSKMDEKQLERFGNAILALAAAGPILSIVSKLTGGLSKVFAIGSKLSTLIANTSAGIGGLSKVLTALSGPAGIVIAVITAVITLLVILYNKSETFRNSVNKAFESIKNSLLNAWEKIKPTLEQLKDAFVELWNKLEPLRNFLVKVLGVAFELLGKIIAKIVEKIAKKITIMVNIVTFIINTWSKIITFFTETLPKAFSQFINNISQLPQKIKDILTNGWNNIVMFFTESIPNFINSIIEWFANLPYEIGYQVGLILGNIIQFGLDIQSWIENELPSIIQGIIDWFAQLPSNILNWLLDAYSKVIQWGQDTYNSSVQWASDTINGIVEWFKSLPEKMQTWLDNTINKIIDWGKNIAEKGKVGAQDLFNKIVETIEGLPQKMEEIGRNIVEGLWNGITGAGDWIKNKVGEFSKGVLDGMKEALGIHSPSRLFRDEVGKYIALGVGEGFTENIGKVYRVMQDKVNLETSKLAGNLSTNIQLADDAKNITGKINSGYNTTNNITVQFYPQQMTESELDRAFNYIDRKYSMAY
ncbi:MAG: tape measure protein [Clostridia bacterium]